MDKQHMVEGYETFAKNNGLPGWKELDAEFFLSFSNARWDELPDNIPIFVMNRMMDYYGSWINFCHTLINGNPQSMILMREAEFFTPDNKKELIKVMTELTIITRKQTVINLENKDADVAAFIKEVYDSWMSVKPLLLKYARISYEKWAEEGKKVIKNAGNMD